MNRRSLCGTGAAALTLSLAGVMASPAVADQGCTGATASTVAQLVIPFGATIVAPTARSTDPNFGQGVIRPEATNCP